MFSPKRNFLISVHYNISKMQIFGTPSPTLGVDKDMRPTRFFSGVLILRNFYFLQFSI